MLKNLLIFFFQNTYAYDCSENIKIIRWKKRVPQSQSYNSTYTNLERNQLRNWPRGMKDFNKNSTPFES